MEANYKGCKKQCLEEKYAWNILESEDSVITAMDIMHVNTAGPKDVVWRASSGASASSTQTSRKN